MTHQPSNERMKSLGAIPQPASQSRSIELDFVRGIAILLAVGWHFNRKDTGLVVVDAMLGPGRLFGWAGVDLFFVLSGFLVGGLIFSEFRDSGGFRARRFLIRRAFKIWPVLYAYILLLVVTGRYRAQEIVPQTLFHVQNYFVTPLNHLWSLAVEEHFYTIFAGLFVLCVLGARASIRRVPNFLLLIMLLALVARSIATTAGVADLTVQIQTQFRIDALACGVWLAYLRTFSPERFERLTSQKAWLAGAVALGVLFLYLQSGGAILASVGYTLTYLAAAAFLLLCYRSKLIVKRNPLARAIAWIGMYSYAMYVFQFVPFRAGEALWKRLTPEAMPILAEVVLRYLGAILLAVLVTRLLEQPMLALRNRLFPSATAPGLLIPQGQEAPSSARH